MTMKTYRLQRGIIEAHGSGGVVLPARDSLAVTQQLDQCLNEVWVSLLWLANRGNFGPFSAADLLPVLADMGIVNPVSTVARIRPRLRRLVDMGLVIEA